MLWSMSKTILMLLELKHFTVWSSLKSIVLWLSLSVFQPKLPLIKKENGGQDKFGRPKAYVHSLKNCDVKEVEKVFGKSRDRIGSASVNLGTKLTSSIQGVWTPAFQRRVQFLLGFHRDPPISHSYPTLENQIINGLKERPELLELFKDQITSIDTVFELPDEIFEALNLKKPDPLA